MHCRATGWIDPALIPLSPVAYSMAANFWRAWWTWLVCFFVTVLVSAFTRKKLRAELVGLVEGLTAENSPEAVSFARTPEFCGFVWLIIFVALNIYFW
jgi:SSS family solute:Na+ symporter